MADLTGYNKQENRLEWFTKEMPIVPLGEIVDQRLTIQNYGFINTRNGRTCVVQFAELPGKVVFANSIIGEIFDRLDADGVHDAACDGETAVMVISRTSEAGRTYYNMVFVK